MSRMTLAKALITCLLTVTASAIAEDLAPSPATKDLLNRYLATLPDAPDGWTLDEVAIEIGRTKVSKSFIPSNGEDALLVVELSLYPGLWPADQASIDAMLDPFGLFHSRIEIEGSPAALNWDETVGDGMIKITPYAGIKLEVEGLGIADSELLQALAGAWQVDEARELTECIPLPSLPENVWCFPKILQPS